MLRDRICALQDGRTDADDEESCARAHELAQKQELRVTEGKVV
jgi:hypothetical protein